MLPDGVSASGLMGAPVAALPRRLAGTFWDYPGDVASRQSARLPPRAHGSAFTLGLRVPVIGSDIKDAFHARLTWRLYQGLALMLQMWAAESIPI